MTATPGPTEDLAKLRKDSAQLRQQLFNASKRNEVLTKTLRQAREELSRIRAEAERMSDPPNSFGTVLGVVTDAESVPELDVYTSGRRMRVAISTDLDTAALRPGIQVRLSEGLVALEAVDYTRVGDVVTVREVMDADRILVGTPGDDEQVFLLASVLQEEGVRPGDAVLVDTRTRFAYEKVAKPEVSSLLLEAVPDISYNDIGGLAAQIDMIQDAVELPFEHPELYTEHGLKPPKGILLYGPPGCGKTLIAKAVAHSLAQRSGDETTRSYFLNIKGPELLDKYVGETERQLRLIFSRAREKATGGSPVVVFFDEMESLFRTRGTGKSSDVETTIVPQLLAEIDGVEQLENVIVIGASNREDLIDPAILRPGRLDVKIRIQRPDRSGAAEIFSKYLTPELPLHAAVLDAADGSRVQAVEALIHRCVERMFSRSAENEFVELTYADGTSEVLYYGDFASGAMISNIVDRAKKHAIKSLLSTGERGISWEHLERAIGEEFSEHEDLPNTSNPDEWSRISGRKGERVTHMRMLGQERSQAAEAQAERSRDRELAAEAQAASGAAAEPHTAVPDPDLL